MKKVFITGEAGMTARRLENDLGNLGYEIVWGMGHRDESQCSFPGVWDHTIKELDITKPIFKYAVIDKKPDVIIHCGALVSTEICKERPQQAVESNVFGTQCVIEAANT